MRHETDDRSQDVVVFVGAAMTSGMPDIAGRNRGGADALDCRDVRPRVSFAPEVDQQEVALAREEPSAARVAQA